MMKTLIFGEHDSLPLVLRSLLKLRHGQIHFRGEWNGAVGEVSDLAATIDIHNKALIDLIFKNGVLGAAEGYIRQLIGWREYVRGLYWLLMPEYKNRNFFEAHTTLPGYYWHGNTSMRCMQQAIKSTIEHAYSHHIQRLMITGNFALLVGVAQRAFALQHAPSPDPAVP